jgi:hypothetical protein
VTTKQTDGKRWDAIIRCVQIVSAVVLAAAIIGILVLGGKQVSVEQIILIVAAAGALVGLAVPRPGSGGGGGAAAAGGVLLVLATLLGGCSGSSQVPAGACTQAVIRAAADVAAACWPRSTSTTSTAEACPLGDVPPDSGAP